MYNILINSEPNIIKKKLAPFIVNNFYCNYLSGNYIDNNLLYLITMMLKDEIDKLENINQVDTFLENSKCGFLLEELRKMPDIQIFFKKLIYNLVEKMERNCSFREINFEISEILKDFNKTKEIGEKSEDKNLDEIINNNLIDPSINFKEKDMNQNKNNNNDNFMSKYVAEMQIKNFKKFSETAQKENKTHLYLYFNKIIDIIKEKDDINLYSNTLLMKNMIDTKLATYMLLFYKNNFLEITSLIKELTKNIMENILLLPNSIKYICKIISLLIKNKFKNITKFEENAFISQFIIGKLLIPIISFPSQNALISEFIVSGNTIKNIKVMNYILQKLFSGKLFYNNSKEANFTPFNWFFIDEMENILYFFEKTINVKIPNFIEKYINDKLPEDYIYDYFEENNEEFCANISVCFTINDINYLIKGLEKSDNYFLANNNNPGIIKLKRAFNKLKSKVTMNEIKEIDNKIKIDNYKENIDLIIKNDKKMQNKDYYYLYNELIISQKYNNLFLMNNKITYFYINLKKALKEKNLNDNEKNIIKIKNYLCASLGNFRLLNKSDFNIDIISNTVKMLNEIKNYMSLPNFILNNNTIPSIWYINSILNYLNKIPEDYKVNNYKKLFNELMENLNESINKLDFEKLILFRNKLKFIDKMNNYYEKYFQLKNNIIINENIKHIVEEAFIPVDIIFKYDNKNEHKFQLEKSKLSDKDFGDKIIYETHRKKYKSLKTIEAFTRYFPNLTIYHEENNTIDIIKELSINQKINIYFEIIKEKIIKKELFDLNKYNSLYSEKIKDYIMNKIYDKIYPLKADDSDTKIYQKTKELAWVEPQLILNKDYIFDNILPDILNEFKQINIFKNPFQKLNCIKKIMVYIESLIKFNEGEDKEIGAEDITPVLNYVFIKAQPLRIHSDIEFTKLFCENSGQFENSLVNFESMCLVIISTSEKTFNLSIEEYKKRCEDELNKENNNL